MIDFSINYRDYSIYFNCLIMESNINDIFYSRRTSEDKIEKHFSKIFYKQRQSVKNLSKYCNNIQNEIQSIKLPKKYTFSMFCKHQNCSFKTNQVKRNEIKRSSQEDKKIKEIIQGIPNFPSKRLISLAQEINLEISNFKTLLSLNGNYQDDFERLFLLNLPIFEMSKMEVYLKYLLQVIKTFINYFKDQQDENKSKKQNYIINKQEEQKKLLNTNENLNAQNCNSDHIKFNLDIIINRINNILKFDEIDNEFIPINSEINEKMQYILKHCQQRGVTKQRTISSKTNSIEDNRKSLDIINNFQKENRDLRKLVTHLSTNLKQDIQSFLEKSSSNENNNSKACHLINKVRTIKNVLIQASINKE